MTSGEFILPKKKRSRIYASSSHLIHWKQKPEDQLWVQHKLKQNAVDYMTLPRNLYPNGAFATIIGSQSEKEAYILHYNYRVGNVKKAHMKRFGDWNLLF